MNRKLLFSSVIFVLLAAVIATPISVRAEGDPPPTPEPVRPPWITGKNPQASLASYEEENLTLTGFVSQGQGVPVPVMAPPSYVDLEPQKAEMPSPDGITIGVPQFYQDPGDTTCGAAALGMALEFMSLSGERDAPSQETLIGDLRNVGLLYEDGTGVEELAYLARQYGYLGSTAFHDWTLEKLAGELDAGHPVVVSLGLNGNDQPGHFVTLTGIAEDGSWVRYNDPILGEQTMSAVDFLASWSAQGNSGLTVAKEALAAANDPMLPWMGLFSAITMLAVVAKYYPLGEELSGALEDIRGVLSNPTRKGFGGKLDPGGAGGSSSPPYKAPEGYKWIQKSVPKEGWKYITTTHSRQVPIFEKKKVQVDTQVWYEKVPRYRTVRVDDGHWVTKKVTKYRSQKYVRYYKTSRVRKTRWVRKGWRFVPQTYYVTKKTPVYGYKKVPYTSYTREWKSKWVTKKVFDGYASVRKQEPVYEYLMMPTGKTKTEYYPKTEKRWGVIGTELEWQLKKVPTPTPTPYPSSTPTPNPSSTTTTPTTPTPNLTSTPYPQITPIPTITPPPGLTSPGMDYDERLERWEDIIDDGKTAKTYGITGYSTISKLLAGLNINIKQVEGTLRVYGPRAARSTVGFEPYTNWIKPANVSNILKSADEFQLSKASKLSTFLGLSLNIASNSIDRAQGDIDRYEYAAALTVDTGITAGSALLAGVVSGIVSGALVGGIAGVGIGAVPGAIAGGIVGAVAAIGGTSWLNSSGARDWLVDTVADGYQRWVE